MRMKNQLTHKQKEILSIIIDLANKKGSSPTLEEVRATLGYSNTSSVQRHTDVLKNKGYLSDTRSLELANSSSKVKIPLVGNVACGIPLLAVENIEAYLFVDADIVSGRPENFFFLRAVGDSMNTTSIKNKTIDDGDFVLIKKQSYADRGSRVVALLGESATIKKYVPQEDCIKLEPESNNPANKPIIVFDDISIQGIVLDVIKKGGD